MNPSTGEIAIAAALLAAAIALVFLFLRYKSANTHRRMRAMMLRAGLDPDIDTSGGGEATAKAIRSRCRKCQAEYNCEVWLAGEAGGDNDFCPNAQVFEILARFKEFKGARLI